MKLANHITRVYITDRCWPTHWPMLTDADVWLYGVGTSGLSRLCPAVRCWYDRVFNQNYVRHQKKEPAAATQATNRTSNHHGRLMNELLPWKRGTRALMKTKRPIENRYRTTSINGFVENFFIGFLYGCSSCLWTEIDHDKGTAGSVRVKMGTKSSAGW